MVWWGKVGKEIGLSSENSAARAPIMERPRVKRQYVVHSMELQQILGTEL